MGNCTWNFTCNFTANITWNAEVNVIYPKLGQKCSTQQFRNQAGGGGGGLLGCSTPNRNLRNAVFLDTMILNVLCDLLFSRNQPTNSADY